MEAFHVEQAGSSSVENMEAGPDHRPAPRNTGLIINRFNNRDLHNLAQAGSEF